MKKEEIFKILQIEETKDENVLKTAYRKLLTQVNPEDDPEGFKNLRQAYEEGLVLAHQSSEMKDTENTPLSQWISEAESVYRHLKTRTDIGKWKILFDKAICKDFDTAQEAKEAFLVFLMSNFRLPEDVWQLIEDTFRLRENVELLYEKFPVNFIDFLMDTPENKGWLDFNLFSGSDDEKIDEYISLYFDFKAMNDEKNYDGIDELQDKLSEIDLYHPVMSVCHLRYYLDTGNKKDALAVAKRLESKEYGVMDIDYYIAYAYSENEEYEVSYGKSMKLLELYPKHYGAIILIGKYYLQIEDYSMAKETYLSLLDQYPYDEPLTQGLNKANEGLIAIYITKLEEDPSQTETRLELAWCYFQNGCYDACINLIKDLEVDDTLAYDYANVISRTYMSMEDYDSAYPYLREWLQLILDTVDDGSEENNKRIKRRSMAYYMLARCHFVFSMREGISPTEKQEQEHQLLTDIDRAIECHDQEELFYRYQKADMLYNIKEYEKCVDACDRLLEKDENYYPAYVCRQEAFYRLRRAQDVIDDFQNAIRLYPQGARPYVFATRVYDKFEMYEDAMSVIQQSRENGAISHTIDYLEIKVSRHQLSENEERQGMIDKLEALYEAAQDGETDLEDTSELLHEKAAYYYDMTSYEEGLKAIDERLSKKIDLDSQILRGSLLFEMKRYEEAIEDYKTILKVDTDYPYVNYMVGLSYHFLGEMDETLPYYKKVAELTPDHSIINYRLMEVYFSKYKENFEEEYYHLAVDYGKRQLEIEQEIYDYTKLGDVYIEGYDLKEAIDIYQKAMDIDPNRSDVLTSMGYAASILGDLEASRRYQEIAIERDPEYLTPYWNLAVYYRKIQDYEKAEEIYTSLIPKLEDPYRAYERLAEVYQETRQWEKAQSAFEKVDESKAYEKIVHYYRMAKLEILKGNSQGALQYSQILMDEYPQEEATYTHMANIAFYMDRNPSKALELYKKGFDCLDHDDREIGDSVLNILLLMDVMDIDVEERRKYVNIYEDYCKEEYGSVEASVNEPAVRKARYYMLAMLAFLSGQMDSAKEYLQAMKETLPCAFCTTGICYEEAIVEGLLMEKAGKLEEAKTLYEKAYSVRPDELLYTYLLKRVEKKLGE